MYSLFIQKIWNFKVSFADFLYQTENLSLLCLANNDSFHESSNRVDYLQIDDSISEPLKKQNCSFQKHSMGLRRLLCFS